MDLQVKMLNVLQKCCLDQPSGQVAVRRGAGCLTSLLLIYSPKRISLVAFLQGTGWLPIVVSAWYHGILLSPSMANLSDKCVGTSAGPGPRGHLALASGSETFLSVRVGASYSSL